MKTVALYGGSFDPPHIGHMLVISYVMGAYPIDELWVIPAFKHRDKELTEFEHRYYMCDEMTCQFNNKVYVSMIAKDIAMGRPDYQYDRTIDLVRRCHEMHPTCKFRWVMGDDLLSSCHSWEHWDEILETARPIVVGRLDYEKGKFQLPNVSSSDIRKNIEEGSLDTLVPYRVAHYIKEKGLYRP